MTLDAAPGCLSADYPYASTVEQNVLIHDGARLRQETELGTWSARRQIRRYTYSTKEIR
jgi:hypothetical protein